jgi:hypothetical protein
VSEPQAIFTVDGDRVFASELARGPWDPNAQHGGAPAALLMRAFEQHEPDPALTIARVTYELLRPAPLGELRLETSQLRGGRRVRLLEATLRAPDGAEVVRARALKVARADVERLPRKDRLPPPPDDVEPAHFQPLGIPMFVGEGIEVRFVRGAFTEPGPATAWFRLRAGVVAGEAPSGLQRLAAAADFPNGIGSGLSWSEHTFINPDLTIYLEREPAGEWICLDAEMRVRDGGAGFSEAVLYDRDGRVGRSLQALVIGRRAGPAT